MASSYHDITSMLNQRAEGCRLSEQQKRLWEQQRRKQAISVSWCRARLHGRVDPEHLLTALHKTMQRHSILRTVFGMSAPGGWVLQKVQDNTTIDWEYLDWKSLHESIQRTTPAEACKGWRNVGFDLERGPVVRARLIRLDEDRFELLLATPSLCGDAVSLQGYVVEISQELAGAPNCADQVMQYSEYVERQCKTRGSENATAAQAYWSRILNRSGISEQRLPFEIPPGEEHAYRAKVAELSDPVVHALKEFCVRRKSSLEAALLACWQVLLWKINSQEKVGFYRWCRSLRIDHSAELRGLLGRYLPVPNRLALGLKIEEVMEELEQYIDAATEWQEYWSAAEGEQRIQFEYRDETPAWTIGQARFAINEIGDEIEHYRVKLCCVAGAHGIRTELHYDRRYFEDGSIERLLEQWQQLVQSAASGNEKIETLEISSPSERELILTTFNNTSCDYPQTCLHNLIQEQVERTPDALAVIFQDEEITYRELNHKANQLAHYLIGMGVGPEVLVGIHLDRSLEMVVALVAVLKAGGAYVPLDPQYPRERLRYMLESSVTPVIITTHQFAGKLNEIAGTEEGNGSVRLLCLDQESGIIGGQSTTNPEPKIHPANLAYVIYTSGSTGKPKGAMNTHKGIVNRLYWMRKTFELGITDRILQKTPFSFDVSVWEFFWPLLTGAALIVATPGGHEDAGYIVDVIQRKQVTVAHFVPSMLQVLVKETQISECTSLRRAVISGEVLSWDLQQSFWAHLPVELHNLYGPTETAIEVTWWACSSSRHRGIVPIGRPIDNTQIYILDENHRPAPIGISGELYIGGVQVGRGYLNRAELTAEHFVPNPYSKVSGDRLYRTGDRARWMHDGQLEFLGRVDDQVKIRGLRVELGEIETVLRQSPAVRDAAVLKKERATGDCLVAYVVPHHPVTFDQKAVKSFLGERLPAYMIPDIMITLERMPYTPSGKLNRRDLPEPEQTPEPKEWQFVAPRTQLEEVIAGIWAEILNLKRVSINSNFFELGGQSILAIRVLTRLHRVLDLKVTPQELFEGGTVARLAELIEGRMSQITPEEELGLAPAPRNIRLPLTAAQERLWFFEQLAPGNLAYTLVQSIRMTGPLNIDAMEKSLIELVRRHESLRTSFPDFRGEPYQQVHPARSVRLQVIHLSSSKDPEQELRRCIEREELIPFNLARGPLFRVRIWQLGPQSHVAAFAVHHIIFDAWSLGIMVREMGILYEAFCKGEPTSLPDILIQYADFAYWEKQALKGQRLENHMAFWRKQFKEPIPRSCLKTDYPRPEMQTFRGAKFDFDMPSELMQAVKELGRKHGATLFMTLLTAFDFLMHYYSAGTDIIVGTDVANRDRVETEGLIGLFANQIAIRCDLSGNPAFLDLLAQVRRTTLVAYSHQEVPLDRIITGLRLQRSAQSTPLFQVKMELVNTPFTPLQLFGLVTEPMGFNHAVAKLDIALLLHEHPSGLKGWYEYNSDLFAPQTIAQMAVRFEFLLTKIVKNPHITLAESVEEINKWDADLQLPTQQSSNYQWWFSWVLQSAQGTQ